VLPTPAPRSQSGFALPELLVSLVLVLVVFGAAMTALAQMSTSQRTIWNRTQMHSGVRGATELLQQEIGQAGLAALPAPVTLTAAVPALNVSTVSVSSTAGMFVGEKLVVGTDNDEETVTLTAVAGNTITAYFANVHPVGAPVRAFGGFPSGVVPPNMANGSSGTVLKLYGDINGDNQMVYVEYTCNIGQGILYRNMMPWNAGAKPAVTPSQILLTNLVANPNGTPCFVYQTQTAGVLTYVTGVAITLSVQTQVIDPITKQFQTETKALLNVSPRNVVHVWQLGSLGLTSRIQPMPAAVQALLQ
jgi:prepilin-type N-terminal cleavage/methylation domain-containing protein